MIKIFLIKEGIGMEFREIVTFLQAAKLQSFSKAARQLGYSQAAVTIQIKQLEQELGVHLFDRIGKQTTLTHQGQVSMNTPLPSYGIWLRPKTLWQIPRSSPGSCALEPLNPSAAPFSRIF